MIASSTREKTQFKPLMIRSWQPRLPKMRFFQSSYFPVPNCDNKDAKAQLVRNVRNNHPELLKSAYQLYASEERTFFAAEYL